MFVAMARHVGLDASYQEVDIPPSWSSQGQSLLLSQHVNVLVQLDRNSQRIVDFNMADFDFDYDRRVISDRRGRAHYFSNIGVERMLAGDSPEAFMNFRQSLEEDDTFGPAWVNLGILYRREGFPDYAEAAFLAALSVDDANPVALSNLASLFEEEGDSERAEYYRDLVTRHRMGNPYYRYQLAQMDFDAGDYDSAIVNLKHAIRARKKEDRFYSLMSSSYLMKGEREEAARWMKKAEEVAVEYVDQRKYNRKFEMLMGLD
jgi:tetratricopeptide (TPR) repeat protein